MRYTNILVGLAMGLLLSACGGGGGNPGINTCCSASTEPPPIALYTTAPDTLTLAPGAAQEFVIGGGTAPYTAVSENSVIAVVSVKDTAMTLGGNAAGTAGISIRDAAGAVVKVAVTVSSVPVKALFTTAPSSITVGIGNESAQTYGIGGGAAPYLATSSNTLVARVAMSGSNYTVTGMSAGAAQIVLLDSNQASLSVAVTVPAPPTTTVPPLFTTAPSAVTMPANSSQTYGVGGGIGPYTATSANTGVVTVALAGGNMTVVASKAGTANVVIRDAAGASVSVAFTVALTPLSVTPNNATGIIDDILVATIVGGTPPYRASVGNILVASASILGKDQLNIQLKQTGQTVITVLDANNQSAPYSVTSNAATPGIRLSPSAISVSEKDAQAITLSIYGATGSVTAFSSDVSLLRAVVSGNKVNLTTGTNGTRCVDQNTNVEITVIDATGASGVANVTITDNGLCP